MAEGGVDPQEAQLSDETDEEEYVPSEKFIKERAERAAPWVPKTEPGSPTLPKKRRFRLGNIWRRLGAERVMFGRGQQQRLDTINAEYQKVDALVKNVAQRLAEVGNLMNVERDRFENLPDPEVSANPLAGKVTPRFINDMFNLSSSVDQSVEECENEMKAIAVKIERVQQLDQNEQMKAYPKLLQRLKAVAKRAKTDDHTLSTIQLNVAQILDLTVDPNSELKYPENLRTSQLKRVQKRVKNTRKQRRKKAEQSDDFYKRAYESFIDMDEATAFDKRSLEVIEKFNYLIDEYEHFADKIAQIRNNLLLAVDEEESESQEPKSSQRQAIKFGSGQQLQELVGSSLKREMLGEIDFLLTTTDENQREAEGTIADLNVNRRIAMIHGFPREQFDEVVSECEHFEGLYEALIYDLQESESQVDRDFSEYLP